MVFVILIYILTLAIFFKKGIVLSKVRHILAVPFS